MKIVGFISLGAGVLLLLAGFFVTPGFVAGHFGSAGGMPEVEVQILRLLAVCAGIIAASFGASFAFPSRVNRFFELSPRLEEKLATRSFSLSFCFACFFIALMLGLLLTQSGPGVSQDSWDYIRTGEQLYQGNLYTFGNFFHFPLYPMAIAVFMHLGFGAEQAAGLIPILSFAFLMFPLFSLGKAINDIYTGYVACLVCLVFTPILYIASWAWTDMPYTFLSVVAILFLVKFAQSDGTTTKVLYAAVFFTALAILMRYIGLTLSLVALVVIFVKNKNRLKRAVPQVLLFGAISCLPVIVSSAFRRTIPTGLAIFTATGGGVGWVLRQSGQLAALREDVVWIIRNVPYEFCRPLADLLYLSGNRFAGYLGLVIIVACLILVAALAIIYPTTRKALLKYLENHYVVISYILLYLFVIVVVQTLFDSPIESRFLSAIFPFIVLVIISAIFYAYRQVRKHSLKPTLFSIVAVFCIFLFTSQAIHSVNFIQTAKEGQVYNAPVFRTSQALSWVALNVPADATLYSNCEYEVTFLLNNRPTHGIPYRGDEEAINAWFGKLKEAKNLYVIFFKEPAVYQVEAVIRYVSISEMTEMNQKYDALVVLADFPEAVIFGVHQVAPQATAPSLTNP